MLNRSTNVELASNSGIYVSAMVPSIENEKLKLDNSKLQERISRLEKDNDVLHEYIEKLKNDSKNS